MSLGHFGATASKLPRPASGGAGATDLMDSAQDEQLPSREGMPANSQQVMLAMRGISHNLVFSSTDADTVSWATGTITLSDGTSYSITGSNTGNMSALTYIYLDIDTSTTVLQTSTTYSNAVGNNKYLIAVAQNATTAASFIVVSGNGAFGGELIVNANMISNLLITAAQIANATITSGKTKIGLHSVSHNLVFSASDFDTVAWASGSIVGSDGTTYTITGANTGDMTDPTYIYLDTAVSSTVLQTTTTFSTAVGDNKILIAVAEDAADSSSLAFFHVFDGIGGISVNAEHIANLSITAGLISNLTITAGKIANAQIGSVKMSLGDDASFGSNFLVNGSFESWADGTTSAPNGWTLTGAGGSVARNTTNNDAIGLASLDVTAALNTATDVAQSITVSATQNTQFRGAAVTFSCKVKASTASRVFLKIDDGVGTSSSSNHTGGGTFESLTVTRTLDASATKVECSLEISSGASITATFDGAMLTFGSTAVEFTPHARDAFIQPRVLAQDGTDTIDGASGGTSFADLTRSGTALQIANVILDGTQSVILGFRVTVKGDVAGTNVDFQVVRNGSTFNSGIGITFPIDVVNESGTVSMMEIDSKPAAGNYTYKVQWKTDGASTIATAGGRTMSLAVVPSA